MSNFIVTYPKSFSSLNKTRQSNFDFVNVFCHVVMKMELYVTSTNYSIVCNDKTFCISSKGPIYATMIQHLIFLRNETKSTTLKEFAFNLFSLLPSNITNEFDARCELMDYLLTSSKLYKVSVIDKYSVHLANLKGMYQEENLQTFHNLHTLMDQINTRLYYNNKEEKWTFVSNR